MSKLDLCSLKPSIALENGLHTCSHRFCVTLLANSCSYLCLHARFHKSLFWVPILAAEGLYLLPISWRLSLYWVPISQPGGPYKLLNSAQEWMLDISWWLKCRLNDFSLNHEKVQYLDPCKNYHHLIDLYVENNVWYLHSATLIYDNIYVAIYLREARSVRNGWISRKFLNGLWPSPPLFCEIFWHIYLTYLIWHIYL